MKNQELKITQKDTRSYCGCKKNANKSFQPANAIQVRSLIYIVLPWISFFENIKFRGALKNAADTEKAFHDRYTVVK